MADAFRCARCGDYHEGRAFIILKMLGRPSGRDYPTDIDLCGECEAAFAAFMGGGTGAE